MSRSRTRRIAKWTGLVLCGLITATLVASQFFKAQWTAGKGIVFIAGGGVTIIHVSVDDPKLEPWWTGIMRYNHRNFWWFQLNEKARNGGIGSIVVPLWPPLLAIAIATAWFWRRDRRNPHGHCRKCGYDLTGNVTGVCSECGTKVKGP